MRMSISVAAGAALCVAAAASATYSPQTFDVNVNGGFIYPDTPQSPYLQKYGKNSGYLSGPHRDLSYKPYQGSASSLNSPSLTITIDLGSETGFDLPINFHFMFYTGSDESPVKQFEILQKIPVRTNDAGKYVYSKTTFSAAERAALASGAGSPGGTFFAEVFSTSAFSGKVTAVLVVPAPGAAVVMAAFGIGGLVRRRRVN